MIAAKKINTTSFPLLKPTIVKVNTSRGDTTVYYTLRLQDGTKELASMAWRREGGNWQIIYDSRLDAELAQLAQDQVLAKDGSLTTTPARLPPAAVRAGDAAAQVQAHFLQEALQILATLTGVRTQPDSVCARSSPPRTLQNFVDHLDVPLHEVGKIVLPKCVRPSTGAQ